MGRPRIGSKSLETHGGEQGHGLKIGTTQGSESETDSGATDALDGTNWYFVTFKDEDFDGKEPLHINFKAEAGIFSWRWNSRGVNTVAADTRTRDIPCNDLFHGKAVLEIKAAAESDLEYEIKTG